MAATKSYNELTVLIPFLNEGEEVITTVKEVRRTAGYNVDIIVVNDHSTDGYHYEEALRPYQVTYIYNKENYGSAPSRDIAVNKCQTPFFLFLDAHMRFYSFDWAQKIVSILKDNDRLILCAQTKALNKNKKGVVYEIKNRETTYGAYMSLINGKFIPDIVWKNSEINPNNETEPIPIVLGAAYAASKRYWKYIKGMSGLKHYGCEEQYMSIKTWLEGGQCILMKNIIIGHIYRNSSPYKLYSETFVYNYLWIASLLFPQTLKCRAFSIAKCNNPIVYKKAKHLFDNNKQLYYRLKSYYQQIFSKEFAIISKLNKDFFDIETSSHAKFDTIISNISSIAEHLKNNIAIENGLLNGKMGQVIWFEQYYKFTGDHLYDNLATEIWESIVTNIISNTIPINFSNGLTGIGWAIFYLYEHHFIKELPSDILYIIDNEVSLCSPQRFNDISIETGLGGILCYTILRLRTSRIQGRINNINESFKKELAKASLKLLEMSSNPTYCYLAMYYLETINKPIEVDDSFAIPIHTFIPKKCSYSSLQEFWGNTLNDAIISSSLYAIISQSK